MGSCCGADKEALAQASAGTSRKARALAAAGKVQAFLEHPACLAAAGIALLASFLTGQHAGCADHAARSLSAADPAWLPLAVCGLPILKGAVESLVVERRIRVFLLISCAMIACVSIGQLFAAGEVAFIMALGEKLEHWTTGRAKKGLAKLVSLVPATARKVVTCPKCRARGELSREVPADAIEPGDGVIVLPGETVPVDGVITEGSTTIDQSVMTGESLPVDKTVGDEVHSGTINRFGAITIRATKAGADSSLQKLVRLMKEAEKKKAPMQRIADRWATLLVPCSLAIAIATFAGVWLATGDGGTALVRGVTILVVFCPCALALATPTSVAAAIGQAAKYGVIIKSGEALEAMGRVKIACIDKTGTLTTGRLSVAAVSAAEGASEDRVLAVAAAAEEASEHPLAQAIVAAAKAKTPALPERTDFEMAPGKGVKALVGGSKALVGNAAWLESHGIRVPEGLEAAADRARREGNAVVFVAEEGRATGFVALSDTIRADARAMLDALPQAGLRPVLLTGDHASTARHVADALGIEDVRAELPPEGKAAAIENMQSAGTEACMIGDGVNDALALETAAVGIAMGGVGSDIAVEAADIALVGDDLTRIPYLKRLSNGCTRLVKFNISLSMCINACAITCSVLGLLTPVTGALVHNLGSAIVVLNAALLYDRKYR